MNVRVEKRKNCPIHEWNRKSIREVANRCPKDVARIILRRGPLNLYAEMQLDSAWCKIAYCETLWRTNLEKLPFIKERKAKGLLPREQYRINDRIAIRRL